MNAAQPGDTVLIRPGTYNQQLTSVRGGTAAAPITIKSEQGLGTVIVTFNGNVFSTSQWSVHEYITVEGLIFDGQYGANDTVSIGVNSNHFTLRNSEVRRSGRDCIDMLSSDDVLIEGSLIHHCLFWNGGRADAHGIAAGGGGRLVNLTIRNTEIHTFSGDAFQIDPNRNNAGWDNILIEGCHLWNAPLTQVQNNYPVGMMPAENGIDTKVGFSAPRGRITVRNTIAHGFQQGSVSNGVGNLAAFNMKERIDAFFDGVTVYDSEIAFRIRGDDTEGYSWNTIQNAVLYNNQRAFRLEENVENFELYNVTFGANNATPFQYVGPQVQTNPIEMRNILVLGTLQIPSGIASATTLSHNLDVTAASFVSAASHNYHLVSGASAINAGMSVSRVTTDRDGVARPQGSAYDIGAYELCSGSACTTPSPSAPTLAAHPQSVSVVAGQTASFSVSATGSAPLNYQWQTRAPGSTSYNTIPGATSASYTTPVTVLADNGRQYRCIVTNSAGSATSNPANLTVTPAVVPPSIVQAPQSQTVGAGQNAVFSALAAGTLPLSYQWQRALSGSAAFTDISGATGSSHTQTSVTSAMSGNQYRVRVSNSAGSVTSSAAILTVPATVIAPSIQVQPQNTSVTVGGNVNFQVVASGSQPLNHQWSSRPQGASSFSNIPGATNSIYTLFGAIASDDGTQFQCVISNSAGTITSSAATLSVTAPGSGSPVLNLLVPLNGSTIFGSIVTAAYFSGGDLSNVDNVQLELDGGFPVQGFSLSGTYNFVNVPPGSHVLRAYLADANNVKIAGTDVQTNFTTQSGGVGGGGALPAPLLNLPGYVPVNGTLNVSYPTGYSNVGFAWTITLKSAPLGSMGEGRGVKGETASPPSPFSSRSSPFDALSATFQTSSNAASLVNFGLVPGVYTVTVQAFDASGNSSAQAQQDVTLVSADLSTVKVYPNPWRNDRHAGTPVTFSGLALGSTVKLFTVSGHWVKTLTPPLDSITWDLTTNKGDKVASGLYIYSITAQGQKKTGQIAVIK